MYDKLIKEFEKEFGVTKCPPGKENKALMYDYGKTAKSKSFSKWNQGKAITLRASGYGTARC